MKKKILNLTKTYHPFTYGGIETAIYKNIKLLRNSYKFDIFSTNKFRNNLIRKNNSLNYSFKENLNFFSTPISIKFLVHFYKNKNYYNLINYHYPWPLMNLCIYFLNKKIKKIVFYHADAISGKKIIDFLYFPFAFYFLKKMDIIVVASKEYYLSSKILKYFKKKIKIIPYLFEVDENKKFRVKDRNYVLYLGACRGYKGFEVIKNAAKLTNCKFILAGNFTKKDIEKFRFSKNVKFIYKPTEKKKNELLRNCSLLILPSTNRLEAFGIVLLEAGNYRKTVISCNLSTGVNSIIKNNYNGYLIKPNNYLQLSKKIKFLMKNSNVRKKMGLNNYKILKNNFNSNLIIKKYKMLYDELLSKS